MDEIPISSKPGGPVFSGEPAIPLGLASGHLLMVSHLLLPCLTLRKAKGILPENKTPWWGGHENACTTVMVFSGG